MDKHQIPSIKFQINLNNRNSKHPERAFGSFGIDAWNLFGIWDLEFGILNKVD
jgi:hypothetical protein